MSPRAAWRLESLGFREVYDYAAGKQDWITSGLPTEGTATGEKRAGGVADRGVPTCGLDERLEDVRTRVRDAGWDVCVVVNEERVVLGLLRARQLEEPGEKRVEEVMRPGPSTFRPNVPIEEMAAFMGKHGLESAPVTTADGVLIGLLKRDDAEDAARRAHVHKEG